MRRYGALSMAVWVFLFSWICSWYDLLQPCAVYAMEPVTTITLYNSMQTAIAAEGGTAAAATQWDSRNISQRSKAGLIALVAKAGIGIKEQLAVSSTQLKAILAVSYNGMQARRTWDTFAGACESATAYGGYLWAKFQGLGIWDLFAVHQAEVAGVSGNWPSVNSNLSAAVWAAPTAIAHGTQYVTDHSLDKMAEWILAVLGGDNHGSPVTLSMSGYNIYASWPGNSLRLVGDFHGGGYAAGGLRVYQDGWQYCAAAIAYGLQQAASGGTAAAPAIDYYPDVTAPGYTTNPDVLPIPVEADTPAVANPTIDDIGAIDYPGTMSPVPWVPPLWVPKTGGLDLSGVRDWLQDLIDDLAGLLPADWSWLLAPFVGFLKAFQAILDWLTSFVAWLEAMIANIFSPSGEQLQLQFEPDWNNLKTKLNGRWPFALIPLAMLIVGSLWGGNMGGGQSMPVSYRLDLNLRPGYDWHIDVNLHDFVDPLTDFRWFWVVLVWVWLAVALWRLLRPVVTI